MLKKFYITTPIYYVNDKAHIGHAYTTIVADTLARAHRAKGEDVLFLTGTDENSQKTVDAAKKNNEEIIPYTDRLAHLWRSTWTTLNVSYTDFIRTTEARHIETVKELWSRINSAGDIYKGKYEGLYCNGHEAFLKEDELVGGLCPDHRTKPELISEENYFFALSKYQDQLLDFYNAHENFVSPANRFAEVRSFVERGLEDISISRKKREWGILVPDDPDQVIYVWFDALINYVSAVGIEQWKEHPADIHAVGKDILRFHAVIWPAMLLSAGLSLPKQIIANGFFTIDGTKISKSLGNVIDPLDLAKRYSNDALKYFLLREIPYGADGDFSEGKMKDRYNGDLANGLGNFVARVETLAEKESLVSQDTRPVRSRMQTGASATSNGIDPEFDKKIRETKALVKEKIDAFKLHEALAIIWELIAFGDFYVNEKKVWAIEDRRERVAALYNLVVLIDNLAALLSPFLPETAEKIKNSIRWEGETLTVIKGEILFPRLA